MYKNSTSMTKEDVDYADDCVSQLTKFVIGVKKDLPLFAMT